MVLQLLLAGVPRWVDGRVACGGGGRERVCNCGRGRVRHDRGRVMGVVGHAGKVVQELLSVSLVASAYLLNRRTLNRKKHM